MISGFILQNVLVDQYGINEAAESGGLGQARTPSPRTRGGWRANRLGLTLPPVRVRSEQGMPG
jgi:hypothetical protein